MDANTQIRSGSFRFQLDRYKLASRTVLQLIAAFHAPFGRKLAGPSRVEFDDHLHLGMAQREER